MCIVSFIPTEKGFTLTSNRDEQIDRSCDKPEFHVNNKATLIYPKDSILGGTWFADIHQKLKYAVY